MILPLIAYLWTCAVVFSRPLYGTPYPRLSILAGLTAAILFSILVFRLRVTTTATARLTSRLFEGGSFLVTLTIATCLLCAGYQFLNTHVHTIPILNRVVGTGLVVLGYNSSCANGELAFTTDDYIIPVTVSCELCDLYSVVLMVTTYCGVQLFFRGLNRSLVVKAMAIAALYAVLRVVVMLVYYGNCDDLRGLSFPSRATMFYDPLWRLVTELPLIFLLGSLAKQSEKPEHSIDVMPNFVASKWVLPLFLASIGSALFAASLFYQSPGEMNKGRVAIDDSHSPNWEPVDVKVDEQTFGGLTLYAYSELARYLRHFFSVETISSGPITSELLQQYDVLVLKTPSKDYSAQERNAIWTFVERGGGLWLIGDHSDLLGMTTYFNALTTKWGFSFQRDSANKLTGGFSRERPDFFFDHVILRNIDEIEFLTSCTLQSGFFQGEIVIGGTNLISDPADYANRNFFNTLLCTPAHHFGCFPICHAIKTGGGRVIAFTDGTVFSNFCFHQHGHPELAVNTIDWLNRKDNHPYLGNRLFLVAGIMACLLCLVLLPRRRGWSYIAALTVAVGLGLIGGKLCCGVANIRSYPVFDDTTVAPTFEFLVSGCRYQLIPPIGVEDPAPAFTYNSFLLSTLRLGCRPRQTTNFRQLSDHSKVQVFVNPEMAFDEQALLQLKKFVEKGGTVLVLDGHNNMWSTANELLCPFGLEIDYQSLTIAGGDSINLGEGLAIASARFGTGKVMAVTDSEAFSDAMLGNAMATPSDKAAATYRQLFAIYHLCLGDEVQLDSFIQAKSAQSNQPAYGDATEDAPSQ